MAHRRTLGLDGRKYPFKMEHRPRENASELHQDAVKLIKSEFPNVTILEEVSAKINAYKSLYLDIYLPRLDIVFEVQGEQHDQHIPFFHADRQSFFRAKYRDEQKREWCRINDIRFVELRWNERDRWQRLIKEAIR